ncbi:MAG TPA: hypothetical protein VL091_15270, partial [Marinobacter sp.]|nr:hypothetical protein [Marinobacter sp.]
VLQATHGKELQGVGSRLDRFISRNSVFSLSDTRLLVAQKRILLDGCVAKNQFTPDRSGKDV